MEIVFLGALLVGGLLVIGFVTLMALLGERRREGKARSDLASAEAKGAQPPSLYPNVVVDRCIGSGTCTTVCPEKDVLALVDGKAKVVNPTSCIGHGECLRACPVDAIELVLGTEKRGVDIPLVASNFETRVPGLFVVGELGGMGLVYNAMTQALQCMDGIVRALPPRVPGAHQVAIVGAGPAGLAAALAAKQAGLDFVVLEQESIGGTVMHYPRHKVVMTKPVKLPLYGTLRVTEVRKEALLEKWTDIIAKAGLEIREGVRVEGCNRAHDGVFDVSTSQGPLRAQRVVLAMGRRGSPRKLGVPGEDLGKVCYRLLEPERYAGSRCLVVGGGDAGVEAAVALGEAGAVVHLAHRKEMFDRIKGKNQQRLDAAVAAGQVRVLLSTTTREIRPDSVWLDQGGQAVELGNDYVLVFAGGVLPTKFLEACGIDVRTFRGERYAPAN